jgi:hypothetical protein
MDISANNSGLEARVQDALLRGQCCSEAIMALCLEDVGKDNEDLVRSMKAFCNGMGEGQVCGTLCAAVAALFVCDFPAGDLPVMQQDLMDWFYDRFGALTCAELVGDDPFKKIDFCPGCVAETYVKLREDFLVDLE